MSHIYGLREIARKSEQEKHPRGNISVVLCVAFVVCLIFYVLIASLLAMLEEK
jgi:hypothetical protein